MDARALEALMAGAMVLGWELGKAAEAAGLPELQGQGFCTPQRLRSTAQSFSGCTLWATP
jgi:hypothetical protein